MMYEQLGDHPDIESIERTGYPRWAQPEIIYCDKCADEIDGTVYEDDEYETLCKSCLLLLHKKRW